MTVEIRGEQRPISLIFNDEFATNHWDTANGTNNGGASCTTFRNVIITATHDCRLFFD